MKYLIIPMAAILMIAVNVTAHAAGNKNILIVLTSHDELGDSGRDTGFWLPELTHPYYELVDAGYHVDVASIQGGMAPIDAKSYDSKDPVNNRFLQDADLMGKVIRTKPLSEFKASDYAAIIYSGGSGTMWDFPDDENVLRLARNVYEQGGVVAAICHGPAALVNVTLSNGDYLIADKAVTAFSNIEEEQIQQKDILPFLLEDKLPARGAAFSAAAPWEKHVVVDGRLVTGQNPASAAGVAHEVMSILEN